VQLREERVYECKVIIQSAGYYLEFAASVPLMPVSFVRRYRYTDLFLSCLVIVIHTAKYQCTSRARTVVHVADVTGSRLVVAGSQRECFSRDSTR